MLGRSDPHLTVVRLQRPRSANGQCVFLCGRSSGPLPFTGLVSGFHLEVEGIVEMPPSKRDQEFGMSNVQWGSEGVRM